MHGLSRMIAESLLPIAALFASVSLAAQPAPVATPGGGSRPLVPPGHAGPGDNEGLAPDPAATAINTTVADIARNPLGYKGRNVAVGSKVEEIYTPWSIRLDEHQAFAGGIDNDMLVVATEPLAAVGFNNAWKGKKVHVTGTVRILQGDDVRREYGRRIDDKLFRQFAGKPMIVAKSITPF